MNIFDIDFADVTDISNETNEKRDFNEPDKNVSKSDRLLHDVLYNNLVHIEKYDIDKCFDEKSPKYFEAGSLSELIDIAKTREGKITAMLLFVCANSAMSEVKEAIDSIKPYCESDCEILFGASSENTAEKLKYRMLLSREHNISSL